MSENPLIFCSAKDVYGSWINVFQNGTIEFHSKERMISITLPKKELSTFIGTLELTLESASV